MDLLGRKAQRQLAQTKARLNDEIRKSFALFSHIQSRELLISDLMADNEVLRYDNARLVENVGALQGALAAAQTPPEPQNYRVSEEEQEAEWQLRQGLIDASEYEHLLKELDFQNANIELDPDYTPREVTY